MKQVFLTGATGAIGSALAPLYLAEPETKLKLLLRAKRGRPVAERLTELGEFWGLAQGDPRWSRIEAIEGDAALPQFGIDARGFDRLGQETTHIVHCAGAVKMTLPLDEARAHAVVPAQASLELAEAARKSGTLAKLDVVSTVGVGGRTPGLIPERPMPEVTQFHNTYEAAKAEAERTVFARWDDLPVTVHRPSMVVGDSQAGRIIHFQVFYHLCEFLSGKRTSGLMPSLRGATLDLVPVDYVARAIHWSSTTPSSAGKILHLCSGPDHAVRLPELVQRIRARAASTTLPKIRFIPLNVFRMAVPVLGVLSTSKIRRALGNLELFLAYLDELQTFDNRQSRALLDSAGIPLPSAAGYLDVVLDYYRTSLAKTEARAR
jgi:thioester reductase-like protein